MPDYGARVADRAISDVTLSLKRTYRTAQKELKKKLASFNRQYDAKSKAMKKLVQEGKISEDDYRDWLTGQVFIRSQWENKIKQVSQVMLDCNRQSMKLIRESKLDVFAENYNYNAFRAEKAIINPFYGQRGMSISFNLYNAQAVSRLILENPQLLPEWNIDEKKDYQWNYQKVNNIVKQGIIQGEGVPEITERLCKDLSTMNDNRMRLFARTAITGAQNAGRQQQMDDAANMGIDVHKQWLATHDSRTRDSHRALDGEEIPYDKEFSNGLRYPGDPAGEDPAEIYNCRCTMVTIYPKYEDRSQTDWRESVTIDGQSYQEWKKGKQKKGEVQEDISKISTLQMYDEALGWTQEAYYDELSYLKDGWSGVKTQTDALKDFEKEIPMFEEILKKAVEREDFSTRTSPDAVIQILQDGRFKTQIETKASHGYFDINKRKRAASQLFAGSEPLNVKNTDYEVYGYLDKAQRADMYGNCRIVMKKENLIGRTTLTVGDSLELIQAGADPMATLVKSPKIFSYGKVFSDSIPNAPQRLNDVRRDFNSIKDNGCLSDGNYVELQFHGGVTTRDIEYIEVSKGYANADKIEKLAKDRGVKIKWKK